MHIPEVPLVPAPQTDEARGAVGFKWAGEPIGKRHKIGGSPDWLQCPEVPTCRECRRDMEFYGQPDSLGDKACLADCGIVYVFVCHGCYTTQSILQTA